MKLSNILIAALAGVATAKKKNRPHEVDVLAAEGLKRLEAYYTENPLPSPGTCTMDNVAVRREW
jgi:tyrosinase